LFGKVTLRSNTNVAKTVPYIFICKKTQSAMNKKVVDLAKKHATLTERNASYMLFENLAVL